MSKLIKPVFNDVAELIGGIMEKEKKKYKYTSSRYPKTIVQPLPAKLPVRPAPVARPLPRPPVARPLPQPASRPVEQASTVTIKRPKKAFLEVVAPKKSVTVGSKEQKKARRKRRTKAEMEELRKQAETLKEQFPDLSKAELMKKITPVKTEEEFLTPPGTPTRGRSFAERRSFAAPRERSISSVSSTSPSPRERSAAIYEKAEIVPGTPSPAKRGRPKKVVVEEIGSGKPKRGRKINPNSKRQQRLKQKLSQVD